MQLLHLLLLVSQPQLSHLLPIDLLLPILLSFWQRLHRLILSKLQLRPLLLVSQQQLILLISFKLLLPLQLLTIKLRHLQLLTIKLRHLLLFTIKLRNLQQHRLRHRNTPIFLLDYLSSTMLFLHRLGFCNSLILIRGARKVCYFDH
jgi:hypothetical protein